MHESSFKQNEFAPRGDFGPRGLIPSCNVHTFVHPRVNTLYCLEEWRGEQRVFTPAVVTTSTRWVKVHP
jgi:hypothetical protein